MKDRCTCDPYRRVKSITLQLIGDVVPIGESEHDERSYKNLEIMGSLFNEIFTILSGIEYDNLESKEFSKREHGEYAKKVLDVFVRDRNSYWSMEVNK